MRGEDPKKWRRADFQEETPPHAWGRHRIRHEEAWHQRNTPTCVGKTRSRSVPLSPVRKHPHMRGEDAYRATCASMKTETPPHAWGRLCCGKDQSCAHRNTPTCVGKTLSGMPLIWKLKETPPRVWGRRLSYCTLLLHCGNTPTCVGKTGKKCSATSMVWKHPHVCGEDSAPLPHASSRPKHPHVCGEDSVSSTSAKRRAETPPRVWGRH